MTFFNNGDYPQDTALAAPKAGAGGVLAASAYWKDGRLLHVLDCHTLPDGTHLLYTAAPKASEAVTTPQADPAPPEPGDEPWAIDDLRLTAGRRPDYLDTPQADPAPPVAGEVLAWLYVSEDGSAKDATASPQLRDVYARMGRTITPLCDARMVAAKDAEIAVWDALAVQQRLRAEAAEQRAEAMVRDAMRYRWLRTGCGENEEGEPVGMEVTDWLGDGSGEFRRGSDLDAAIDAALAGQRYEPEEIDQEVEPWAAYRCT